MTESLLLRPRLAPPAHVHPYARWTERYGYFVDEMVAYALARLPTVVDGEPVAWDPRRLWTELAALCYATSTNRFKRYKPVLRLAD